MACETVVAALSWTSSSTRPPGSLDGMIRVWVLQTNPSALHRDNGVLPARNAELRPTFDDPRRGMAGRLLPSLALAWPPLSNAVQIRFKGQYRCGSLSIQEEHVMRKVLRGYAKNRDGNLILMGTIPALHSKDKASPRERQDKRHLIRQGATIFKKEIVR
jgi:hypothetical protein